MQIMKKAFAIICTCVMVIVTISSEAMAAEYVKEENTSHRAGELGSYGFVIDSATYNKICRGVRTTIILNDVTNGKRQEMYRQECRVYICREKGTYNDYILTVARLCSGKYTWGGMECHGYPESLTVSCNFPTQKSIGVEMHGTTPTGDYVSESYSVGASLGATSEGIETGVEGSVSVERGVLDILDCSYGNTYKVVYDFQPGATAKDRFFTKYLHTSKTHIGTVCLTANSKNYGFCMKFSSNVATTRGLKVYNSAKNCTRITDERAIVTCFK